MTEKNPVGMFVKHPGVVGEAFDLSMCESCGAQEIHSYEIVAGTDLGSLLGLEESSVAVETEMGTEYVDETGYVCGDCLEHLLEAKELNNAEND